MAVTEIIIEEHKVPEALEDVLRVGQVLVDKDEDAYIVAEVEGSRCLLCLQTGLEWCPEDTFRESVRYSVEAYGLRLLDSNECIVLRNN